MKLNLDQITAQRAESHREDDRWPVRTTMLFMFAASVVLWVAIATAVIMLL